MLQTIRFFSFIFLFISPSFAGFNLCFERRFELSEIKSYLSQIASPADKIYLREREHCLDVEASPLKESLYRKWAQNKYTLLSSSAGSNYPSVSKKLCRLKLREEGFSNQDRTDAGASRSSINLGKSTSKSTTNRTRSLLVQNGKSATLGVDGSTLKVICHWRSSDIYEIETILEGKKNSLSSSLTLRRGQPVELGSVVDDLNDKDNSVSLSGIKHQKRKRDGKTSFWLEIE